MTVNGVGRRKKPKPQAQQQVHMVVDSGNSPGKVYACFAYLSDAERFMADLESTDEFEGVECEIESRTLWYGQPNVRGYNP